ncbi:hypothetical protein C0V80_09095 [Leuconostoc pseudomesenteroides]|nr:hypothetical protein [Leuconostoc pseudomesenteroides]MCC7669714.1 hypothetical protein [Leuconostoc pseudomesenteroides]MCC8440280.1 hypothetical protein [Leuconostoc pseudomesenteroides]QQB26962.1 hypothetical protein I6H60_07825 [Leuconostoc pseudomesenteroides]
MLIVMIKSIGLLVQRFGLTAPVAFAIINLLSTGGAYAVAVAYPFFAPFIATAKAYLAVFGMTAGVAF